MKFGWVLGMFLAAVLAGCSSAAPNAMPALNATPLPDMAEEPDASSASAPFGPAGVYSGRLVAGGDYHLRAGEQDPAAVLLLDGTLAVEREARLGGPLVILGGTATVDGQVETDVTVLNGALRLGPTATLLGRLRLGGGDLEAAPGAVVTGGVERGSNMQLPAAPRQLPGSWLARATLLAGLAYLTVRSTPRAVGRVGQALIHYPVITAAMGLLAGVTGLTLLVLMAFTIVLIPVTLLGFLVAGLAVTLGWIGLGLTAGLALAERFKWRLSPPASAALGTLLLSLAFEVLRWLPFVGGLPMLLVAVMALGAVLLTRFGLITFIPAAELE